jgi:ABC-type spermidine/putrescine transport system permease subunit II
MGELVMANLFNKKRRTSRFKQRLTLGVSVALGIAFGTVLKSVVLGASIAFALWYSSDNRPD